MKTQFDTNDSINDLQKTTTKILHELMLNRMASKHISY